MNKSFFFFNLLLLFYYENIQSFVKLESTTNSVHPPSSGMTRVNSLHSLCKGGEELM